MAKEEIKRIRKGLINFQGNEVVEKHLAFIKKKTGEKTDAEVIRRAIREDAEKRGFK